MKRIIALLLALFTLASFCACSNSAAPSAGTDTPANTDTQPDIDAQSDNAPSASADNPAWTTPGQSGLLVNPDPSNPAVTAEPLVIPLASNDPEITLWESNGVIPSAFETDYANTDLYNWIYDTLGVKLKVSMVIPQTATEQFNLMIVSGDVTDIISDMSSFYKKGGQNAVDEGLIYDLTDYVAKYMPNYQAMRALSDMHTRASMTDEGQITYIHKMDYTQEVDWQGLGIYSNLLDELGLALPVTYDDWDNVLTQIHETWGGFLNIPTNGVFPNSEFASGYGIGTQWYQKDGKVYYGAVEPEYKQYLSLLRDWFSRGLINPDFMSSDAARPEAGRRGQVAFTFLWGLGGHNVWLWGIAAETEDENLFLQGVPHPVQNEGDQAGVVSFKASVVRQGAAVSATADDPVLCCKFMDYFYSPEGGIYANYGPIGKSCYIAEDGEVKMTDAYLAEVEEKKESGFFTAGATWENLLYKYSWYNCSFGVMMPERLLGQYDDVGLDAWRQCLVWTEAHSGEYNYPEGTTMTSVEAEEYGRIYADATSTIDEWTAKIIAGMVDLDEGYDAMTSILEGIHFNRCIEIKQAALDRFNER